MTSIYTSPPRLTRHLSDHHAVQGEAEYVERHAPLTASPGWQPIETVAETVLTGSQVQKAWVEERDRLRAEIERLTARAEKAEVERDEALAREANANRMSVTGYSAGFAAGVNAAVAAYDSAIGGDVHDYGINRMLDVLAAPTPSPEAEGGKHER